ncbi:uncharacterized protein HMPREF1120_05518 [Exophiala dermatitidis NIH/UT8656]|uniref:Uncharacterized protein n=1 Tax=Exophiala dermatitidis (strain ATCC 34100 / CBS 525.76 / NIH/UT8656) TaxID=858893 RepID=H6BY49_EXODN|nr:uncharacterized protein HMPREF1120_05518 [Exophiala dermatitidis NIH/UT8656]EHY57485.1 hypothetical protein HMPREF1120_05518 [Exophiala dermatitidis NIH/UT8656]
MTMLEAAWATCDGFRKKRESGGEEGASHASAGVSQPMNPATGWLFPAQVVHLGHVKSNSVPWYPSSCMTSTQNTSRTARRRDLVGDMENRKEDGWVGYVKVR